MKESKQLGYRDYWTLTWFRYFTWDNTSGSYHCHQGWISKLEGTEHL